MSGQADRTVDEVLRELSEKYGTLFSEYRESCSNEDSVVTDGVVDTPQSYLFLFYFILFFLKKIIDFFPKGPGEPLHHKVIQKKIKKIKIF